MQDNKRGNPHRRKKQNRHLHTRVRPLEKPCLTLHTVDMITGNGDIIYSLFYEYYRGYTIYSTERGRCCIHGVDGCLRIQGKYVVFPHIGHAKNMIKYFLHYGYSSKDSMCRDIPADKYIRLNAYRYQPLYQFTRT